MPATPLAKLVASTFGKELRSARTAAGLTQQALAEQINVDPVYVSYLENGRRQPSLTVVVSVERALQLEAGELSRRVAVAVARNQQRRATPTGKK